MNNLIPSVLVSIGLSLGGFLIGQGFVRMKQLDQIVEVRGLDEKLVEANEATWDISFSLSGNNLQEMTTRLTQKQTSLKEYLLSQGFTRDEFQASAITTNDNHANHYGNKLPADRFTVRTKVMIGTKQVQKITEIYENSGQLPLEGLVREQSSVQYYFTDLNAVKPEMLKNATASAREAAESFARDSGSKLGGIKSATQGLFSITSPYANWDDATSKMKKVRVVTRVSYFLE
ncbi:MAG: SIMPL domain-containing protein [Proteobacteria bacterium]|nr:SIMPL domain-containing protein [Pseudomonadota bacterium]